MHNSTLFRITGGLVLAVTLSADLADAGWMATANFSGCPSNVKATSGSEGPFNSELDCLARVREVERSQNMSCVRYACSAQPGSAGSASPQAGHEMDELIGKTISYGVSGDIAPADAVGLVGLGLIGNALNAPSAPERQKTPAEITAERVAAEKFAIENARREREREEKADQRVAPMFALLDPLPLTPAQEPVRSSFFTKGFEHASQCISQNAGTSCSGEAASEQQNCVADYRAGYDAGNRQKVLAMEEALQAGLKAGANGELANGGSDARANGPCRIEWIESDNKGFFQGKNRKSVN